MGTIKVCHMTCVHKRYDARIFMKECCSLVKNGFDVSLIVADGNGDEIKNGVKIYDVGSNKISRLKRMTKITKLVKQMALELDCEIYHFHDPELLFVGLSLQSQGKKVIYDMHEDYPGYFAESDYLPMKSVVSFFYEKLEVYSVKRFSGVVSTRQSINDRLGKYNKNINLVTNFPILTESIMNRGQRKKGDEFIIAFAGAIVKDWNIDTIIDSIEKIDNVKFILAGPVSDVFLNTLKQKKGWNKVDYKGIVTYKEVRDIYSKASIGIAVYNYCNNMGGKEGNLANTKMFEFMDSGIPFICTDFKIWKTIVEDEVKCGLCVCPNSIRDMEYAINYLKDNPAECLQMGLNARRAAENFYNWSSQEKSLLKLYETIAR